MLILFCAFKKDLEQIIENHTMTTLASKKTFLWQHLEISSVLLFNKVSGSAQMMEAFSDKHRLQGFEPHWYGEAFLQIFHDRLFLKP